MLVCSAALMVALPSGTRPSPRCAPGGLAVTPAVHTGCERVADERPTKFGGVDRQPALPLTQTAEAGDDHDDRWP